MGWFFHGLKNELQFFATKNCIQVELPELARETKSGPTLIEIHDEFEADYSPEIRQRHIGVEGLKFHLGVEGKDLPLINKAVERVTVEVIAVRRIGGPIGIRIVWRSDDYPPAGPGDAMQLSNKRHHVGHMFGDVTTDNFVE